MHKPRMYKTLPYQTDAQFNIYKMYRDKRPSNFSEPHHPFYLAAVTHVHAPAADERWLVIFGDD